LYFAFGVSADPAQMQPLQHAGRDRFVLAADPETAFQFSGRGPHGATERVVLDALNSQFAATRAP
jgi:hypothetical protein